MKASVIKLAHMPTRKVQLNKRSALENGGKTLSMCLGAGVVFRNENLKRFFVFNVVIVGASNSTNSLKFSGSIGIQVLSQKVSRVHEMV
jgi:hypothetical protein